MGGREWRNPIFEIYTKRGVIYRKYRMGEEQQFLFSLNLIIKSMID